MPAQMRASMTSLSPAENRAKLRVVCELLLNALNAILSVPKNAWSVLTMAPDTHRWPDGCSGKGGVASNGVQVGSALVAGLPSVSAWRIALIGRQKVQ